MSHKEVHSDLVCPIKSQYMFPLLFFSAFGYAGDPRLHLCCVWPGRSWTVCYHGLQSSWSSQDHCSGHQQRQICKGQTGGCHWVHQPSGLRKTHRGGAERSEWWRCGFFIWSHRSAWHHGMYFEMSQDINFCILESSLMWRSINIIYKAYFKNYDDFPSPICYLGCLIYYDEESHSISQKKNRKKTCHEYRVLFRGGRGFLLSHHKFNF